MKRRKEETKQMIRTILATAISMLILSAHAQAPAVEVSVDRPFYQPKDDIMVSIQNNRQVSILTYDHQSYCTIVTLQMQQPSFGGWVDLAPCRMGIPDRPVEFAPGEMIKVTLPGGDPRPVGTYRVRFYYYLLGGLNEPAY